MSVYVELVTTIAVVARGLWVYSAIALALCKEHGWHKPAAARWFFHEIRPFYLPAVLIDIAEQSLHGRLLGLNMLFAAIGLLAWWWYKDVDEDDRWRRRRNKVAEKVALVGARLIVVSAESSAS